MEHAWRNGGNTPVNITHSLPVANVAVIVFLFCFVNFQPEIVPSFYSFCGFVLSSKCVFDFEAHHASHLRMGKSSRGLPVSNGQ